MIHNPLLTIEIDILVLLAVACLSAIALKRLKFPYTVALVILGFGLGWLGKHIEPFEFLQTLTLSHDLILFVFVPPLIFESALNLDSRLLLRNLTPILTLAAPGLLLSTAIVGAILSWGTILTLPQSLLFGSLISATDPVAVIALFKELGAPKRLGILVEGESLFNDATAIVTFNIILGVIITGQEFGLPALQQGFVAFLINFGGGIVVGSLVGLFMRTPISLSRDNPLVLATLTTILAYTTFLVAEEVVHVSGVIAVVSAGIVLGWYKTNHLKFEDREFIGEYWEYLAFLANSLIFLLVGLTVSGLGFFLQVKQTQDLLGAIGLTLISILLARAIVVFGFTALLNRWQPTNSVELSYQIVSYWGGLRGAVCLALALSFEPDFPNRELMLMLTLGVVIFTLLIPGTTIAALLKKLRLDLPPLFDRLNQALARSLSQHHALEQLPLIETTLLNPRPEMLAAYQQKCQTGLGQARQVLTSLFNDADEKTRQQWVWFMALNLERQIYRNMYDAGFMDEPFLAQFNLMLNLKQDAVAAGEVPPSQPDQLIFEAWVTNLTLMLGEKWMPQNSEVNGLRAKNIFNTGKFWGFTAHASKMVPIRLKAVFEDSGLDVNFLQPCITQYQQWNKEAVHQVMQLETEPLVELQQQIAERISQRSQGRTIEDLISIGAISEATGNGLIQSD